MELEVDPLEIMMGRWRARVLYAGVVLGVFDALREGPRAAADVAQACGTDPENTYRLVRALARMRLLAAQPDMAFRLTNAGTLLTSDNFSDMRAWALFDGSDENAEAWRHLPDLVREGAQDGFARAHGMSVFDYAAGHRDYAALLSRSMTHYSIFTTPVLVPVLREAGLGQASHLCDVGGGHGHLLCHILADMPHLRGTVFDLPGVIADAAAHWAEPMGVAGRCAFEGGDMFRALPVADAYVLRMVLHDWDDDAYVEILRSVARAAEEGARLFLIEILMPEPGAPRDPLSNSMPVELADMQLMCMSEGKLRNEATHAALLAAASWRHDRTWPTTTMFSVLVAERISGD